MHTPLRTPFVADMTLAPRAPIALQARTSGAARVYLLHCDAQAALSIFPDAGGITFRADQWVSLPAADMPLRTGTEPGVETLYVLATREPLAQSDGALARWLADRLLQPEAARCDLDLSERLAGPSAPRVAQPTAANPPPRKLPYAVRGVDISNLKRAEPRAFAADDGIVVLRLAYTVSH